MPLGEGGHSQVKIMDNSLLLRNILKDMSFAYDKEIEVTRSVSDFVIRNVSPHFIISYKLIQHREDTYHIIERMDGDISNTALFNVGFMRDKKFMYQMMVGLLSLVNNNIRVGDVKRENILHKKLDHYVTLRYDINGVSVIINTDVLFFYTDFGRASEYDFGGKSKSNISDLNSIASIDKGESLSAYDVITTDHNFLLNSRGSVCGITENWNSELIGKICSNRDRFMRCIINYLTDPINVVEMIRIPGHIIPQETGIIYRPLS